MNALLLHDLSQISRKGDPDVNGWSSSRKWTIIYMDKGYLNLQDSAQTLKNYRTH